MTAGAEEASCLPARSEACETPRKDGEIWSFPWLCRADQSSHRRDAKGTEKGKTGYRADVPLGFAWWAEYPHSSSLPRACCAPVTWDLRSGRSREDFLPCASGRWPCRLASLHGSPLPRMEMWALRFTLESANVGSVPRREMGPVHASCPGQPCLLIGTHQGT